MPTPSSSAAAQPRAPGPGLAVELRARDNPAAFVREPVSALDLGELVAEVDWQLWCQHGASEELIDHHVAVRDGDDQDNGTLRLTATRGRARCSLDFGIEAFAPVVGRAIADARIEQEDRATVTCRLVGSPSAAAPARLPATDRAQAPSPLLVDTAAVPAIRDAIAHADSDAEVAVLFAAGAHDRAERCSRRGPASADPFETGGLLLGHVARCARAGALLLVEDVLPANDTSATEYSLEFSAATWKTLRSAVRARQRTSPSLRIIGQTHGHPPVSSQRCLECDKREVCTTSTAFLSSSDRQWCRAVFPQSPWQLSQVFGWNARQEPDESFYGWRRGMLRLRDRTLIDDGAFAALLATADNQSRSH